MIIENYDSAVSTHAIVVEQRSTKIRKLTTGYLYREKSIFECIYWVMQRAIRYEVTVPGNLLSTGDGRSVAPHWVMQI